ncbi:MAG: glycosyltransferase family 2 protein [Candidatus Micrarchaeaceae archaeon]
MPVENDYSDSTVIIPIKNEPAAAINGVIRDIIANMPGAKIIVIYKGNNEVSKKYIGRLTLLMQKSDGKGAACYEAEKHVDTDIMCFIDGDSTYLASDLKKLVKLVRGGADIAIGNRLHNLSKKVMPSYVRFGNRVLSATLNILYGTHFKDSQTGLRAMRKDAFRLLKMTEKRFGFEEEMLIKAKRKNYTVAEIPIRYRMREGLSKQMKPLDGMKLMLILFRHLIEKE